MSGKQLRVVGIVFIVVALLVMQSDAQQGNSNFSAVTKTAGATAALYGAGAVLCTALTAGSCGLGIAVGGVVMGVTATTINMLPPPNDTVNWRNGSPGQMPDYEDASGGCVDYGMGESDGLEDDYLPADCE